MKDPFALTRSEEEVLAMVRAGASNREISEPRFVSPETTKTHIRVLRQKLGAGFPDRPKRGGRPGRPAQECPVSCKVTGQG